MSMYPERLNPEELGAKHEAEIQQLKKLVHLMYEKIMGETPEETLEREEREAAEKENALTPEEKEKRAEDLANQPTEEEKSEEQPKEEKKKSNQSQE